MSLDKDAAFQRLDGGSLADIFADRPGRVEHPIVQCVQIKPMAAQQGGAQERWRVVFSDGQNYVQTMLATSLNDFIRDGRLLRGFLVKLLGYQGNNVKQKK
jgi:replication factor A1